MSSKVPYSWGTERPSSRLARIRTKQIPTLSRQIDEAKKRLDQLVADLALLEQEADNIAYLLESGRYDPSREADLIERGHVIVDHDTSSKTNKRGGRPRKYPDTEYMGRPTRAKTPAGIERARKGLNLRSCYKRSDIPISTVSRNSTECKHTEDLSKTGCEIQDHAFVDLSEQTDVASEATLIDALPVEDDDALAPLNGDSLPSNPHHYDELCDNYRDSSTMDTSNDYDEPIYKISGRHGDLPDIEGVQIFNCLELYNSRFTKIWHSDRRQEGVSKDDYDFRNPYDESCGLKALKDLFPSFGLPVKEFFKTEEPDLKKFETSAVLRSYKLGGARPFDESTAKKCIELFWYNRPDPQPELNDKQIQELLVKYGNGSYVTLLFRFDSMFLSALRQEVDRIIAWPLIELRLGLVEYMHMQVLKGSTDLDHARVVFALKEYIWLATLAKSQQNLYFRAVRAMKWADGFSLQEMIDWSENDHYKLEFIDLDCFPRWLFPKRLLHVARMAPHAFYCPEVDGNGIRHLPSVEKLNEFWEEGDAFAPWFERELDAQAPDKLKI